MKDQVRVFAYTNYREFLSDFLSWKIEQEGLSYRYFAKKAKINAPSYFQQIILKKRNLTPETAKKVALGLGLNQNEQNYFLALVKLEQVKSDKDKNEIFNQLKAIIEKASRAPIKDISIHSNWLHGIIWELALLKDFVLTQESIFEYIKGLATREEITASINFLTHRGWLKETTRPGIYEQKMISFEPLNDVRRIELQQCHLRFLEIAKHRINDDLANREFQGLTLAIPRDKMEEIKERLRKFIFDLNEDFANLPDKDAVIQVECCAFYLAAPPTKKICDEDDISAV